MDISDFDFLISAEGRELLGWAANCGLSEFALAAKLREKTSPQHAAALTQTLFLRSKAGAKFSRASEMFFTSDAAEQASAEIVTSYRARRFEAIKPKHLIDLCCSIGSDALPLADFSTITGIDLDPLRLKMAEYNFKIYNKQARFIEADVTRLNPSEFEADAFFIDPARRTENGERIFDPNLYSPPLSEILRWQKAIPNACAKLGPGVDKSLLPRECEIEFISVNGNLREACLWFGDLAGKERNRATLLPEGISLTGVNPVIGCKNFGEYLIEPDSSVTRAGLVELLGSQINAWKIDPQIAYLSSDTITDNPFAACYQVYEYSEYNEKEIRKIIRERQIGNLDIKRRGSIIDPQMLRKKLKLKGKNSATLFLTRLEEKQLMILTSMRLRKH